MQFCKSLCLSTMVLFCLLSPFSAADAATRTYNDTEIGQMIGQMIMLGFRGSGLEKLEEIPATLKLVQEGKIGGIILFSRDAEVKGSQRNIQNAIQLRGLITSMQWAAR